MSGFLGGAALGMLLLFPLMFWPGVASQVSDLLLRAAQGEDRARGWALAMFALGGGLVGLFLGS